MFAVPLGTTVVSQELCDKIKPLNGIVQGAAELFGSTAGFKTSEPNVTPDTTPSSVELEDDF